MRLAGGAHLTYCTNIHPGESWPEVRAQLASNVARVRSRVCPDAPFGVGLRLSNAAAEALAAPEALADLRALSTELGLYVFTINGFPFGTFHGRPVKEGVYRPDWLEPERLAYTLRLAQVLARILPDGVEGSISTVPCAFAPRVTEPAHREVMASALSEAARGLAHLREETGKTIRLALEPEPCCFLETIEQTVRFFEDDLFASRLASQDVLREHLGVCLDACHAAVEYESAAGAIAALDGAGILVPKVQLSSALRIPSVTAREIEALGRFAEPVYLHQVVERRPDGALVRYTDLPDAIRAHDPAAPAPEWRIHFHVPIFLEQLGAFSSTQPFLRELLQIQRARPVTAHLEVETYTFDVLPEEHRGEPVDAAIARELGLVLSELAR